MSISGPRAIRVEEISSLRKLLNATFRANRPGDMFEQFANLFDESNYSRLVVMSQNGEVVSHTGMLLRDVSFEGIALKVALVGAVATAECCRGRGYATRCLNRLLTLAVKEGADLAWISGTGVLYSSRGAACVGRLRVFNLSASALPAMPARSGVEGKAIAKTLSNGPAAPAKFVELRESDLPEMAALQRREPAHFLRLREDWLFALRTGRAIDWKTRFFGLRRNGRLTLWLAMNEPREKGKPSLLAEFAGERADLVTILSAAVRRMRVAGVWVRLPEGDIETLEKLAPYDAAPTLEPTSGRILPLRMSACFDKLRPRLAEAVGGKIARKLIFSESGVGPGCPEGRDDTLRIRLGKARLDLHGRAEVAQLLFGSPEGSGLPAFSSAPPELSALRDALPLPTPSYGLNFV